jgi:pimeloyl-ACP methyl ester carboxylesterase/DNA-binding CsgD family transcriptional regulator
MVFRKSSQTEEQKDHPGDPVPSDGPEEIQAKLDILESLAEVGDHPEKLLEISAEWDANRHKTSNLHAYESVLEAVYNKKKTEINTLHADFYDDILKGGVRNRPHSFIIDTTCTVKAVGGEAKELLGTFEGDNIDEFFTESLRLICLDAIVKREAGCYTDVVTREGTRYLVYVLPYFSDMRKIKFFDITLCTKEISQAARDYIREKLTLTQAEIEILQLILQRHELPEIAARRNSTLNTTRTHINNIKKKFRSHSLNDVILSVNEINAVGATAGLVQKTEFKGRFTPILQSAKIVPLKDGRQIEYSSCNEGAGRALVILHSLEYGGVPPAPFVEAAGKAGYALYVPCRPGFGQSTPAANLQDAAALLQEFIEALALRDVTLVAMSMGVPTALHLLAATDAIEHAYVVNYGFAVSDKINQLEPAWLRGMLQMGLRSEGSARYILGVVRSMIRAMGYKRFYRRLYEGCPADTAYLAQHDEQMKLAAEFILSAHEESVRNDLIGALLHNTEAEQILASHDNISGILGDSPNNVDIEQVTGSAEKLNVPVHLIEGAGRNCIYQQPDAFFSVLAKRS